MDDQEGTTTESTRQPLTSGQRQSRIDDKYLANTWLGGITDNGYMDFTSPPGGRTMYEGGSIWIGDEVGNAQMVYGSVLTKYLAVGAQSSFLRFPTTDEWDTPDYDGRYNHFQGGSIFYKWGASEAYEVHGWIRDVWIRLGWERSKLGWPVSDEYVHGSGTASRFEYGGIYYTPGSDLEDATHPVLYTVSDNSRLDADAPTLDTKMIPNAWGWWLQAWGRNWTPGARVYVRMMGPTGGYYLGQGTVWIPTVLSRLTRRRLRATPMWNVRIASL